MSGVVIRRATTAIGTSLALLFAVSPLASATVARPAAAQAAHHVRTFTTKENGKTVTVHKGHKFRISLKTCTDCGDHWVVKHKPNKAVVVILHKRVRTDSHQPGVVGAPAHTIWTLKAVGAGTTRIRLAEVGPDGSTVKHYKLRIHVR